MYTLGRATKLRRQRNPSRTRDSEKRGRRRRIWEKRPTIFAIPLVRLPLLFDVILFWDFVQCLSLYNRLWCGHRTWLGNFPVLWVMHDRDIKRRTKDQGSQKMLSVLSSCTNDDLKELTVYYLLVFDRTTLVLI